MKGLFNTVLGQVEAKENKKQIILYGINGYALTDEISRVWNTTRITKHVFHSVGRLQVSFHKFFLIDIIYTLETLIDSPNLRISKRSLIKAVEALKELTDLRTVFNDKEYNSLINRQGLNKFNVTPTLWQDQYLDIYSDRVQRYALKGHLLDADPGTGKTLGSLMLMECLPIDTIFMIVPKNSIKQVWEDTLNTRYKEKQDYYTSSSGISPTIGRKKYIIHYEYLPSFLRFLNSQNANVFGRVGIVIDESQSFNDERSLRSETLVNICKNYATYSLFMSGTPLKALGKETIPLLSSIDPIFDKEARDRYVSVFGMASDRALDILRNRIGIISHKVKKDTTTVGDTKLYRYEAKISIPNGKEYTISSIREKMRKYIEERSKYYKENMDSYIADYHDGINYYKDYVKNNALEKEQLNIYLEKVKEIRNNYDPVAMKEDSMYCNNFEKRKIIPALPRELKNNFRKAKSVYKYVNLTIMGECLGTVLGKERAKCNRDIAIALFNNKLILKPLDNAPIINPITFDEIIVNASKKTILFTSFIEVIKDMSYHLQERGYTPAIVYGDTNKDLSKIINGFEKEDRINPLIATFQSLSTAVPLVMANTIVMLNRPFRDWEYKQAVARAWRKGQTDDVNVFDIYLDTGNEPNISTRSKDIADEAASIVAKIMGYDEKAIETLSQEACSTCNGNGVYSDGNNSNYTTIDRISNNPDTKEINTSNSNYYKTDNGFTLKTIKDLTDDDPMWDNDESKLVLNDINNDSEKPSYNHTNKNSFISW